MTEDPETLQRQIAELQRQLAALQAAALTPEQVSGTVDNAGTLHGVAVGVNYGRIVYGRDASEDERRRLGWYLDSLANKLYRLPLRGIEQKLDQGEGIALPQVYVELAATSKTTLAFIRLGSTGALMRYRRFPGRKDPTIDGRKEFASYFIGNDQAKGFKPEYHPDWSLPYQAVAQIKIDPGDRHFDEPESYELQRSRLITETIIQTNQVVLLGSPGSGKSTFLRHLAWALAQRGLGQPSAPVLFGWPNDTHALPLLLPLRALAGRIATQGPQPAAVAQALSTELAAAYAVREAEALVEQALHSGSALLLLDGLDEVPIDEAPGRHADRATVLRVVRQFAQLYPSARFVLTCRTRAFDDALRTELGWHVETIAPFTLGQIRHFVPAWYGELVAHGQLDAAHAKAIEEKLIRTITDPQRARLRGMAENPLLLTMMALILYNQGELPRDRPQLYERILDLLLGQWDKVREGESLAEAVKMPSWESRDFLPLLDRLCYEAHRDAGSGDGRGQLSRAALYLALIDFFKAARAPDPGHSALCCLDYFEQRSGLLVADSGDTYAFAHLTLQEHGAGRYLAVQSEEPAGLLLKHRADDRWREPIMLGAGLLRPGDLNTLLADLIDREEANEPKPGARWYRDLIFAAEIGQDRDWNLLRTRPAVKVERLQRELRAGLVALLADKAQPLPVAERVRAGFLLGHLGDPRYPVTLDDWWRELAKVQAGDTSGYFCKVGAGTYTIGSADDDPEANDNEKPQHQVTFDAPFWIGRYPVTNDQWQRWVSKGGGRPSNYAEDMNLNSSNQPVVGTSWDGCNDFCGWLSTDLAAELRLPTEFEFEAAAAGHDRRRYPWGEQWLVDYAATAEDQELRGSHWTIPVGCYPAGAAACGSQDLAGNVWEWTSSVWQAYDNEYPTLADNPPHTLRGGRFDDNRTDCRCQTRLGAFPDGQRIISGFRVVVVLRSAPFLPRQRDDQQR